MTEWLRSFQDFIFWTISILCSTTGLLVIFLLLALSLSLLAVSHKVRYLVKYSLFVGACMSGLPMALIVGKDYRVIRLASKMLILAVRLTTRMRYVVRGQENIVQNKTGAVLLLNHQSILDMTALAEICQLVDNLRPVAKREVRRYLGFGPTVAIWGAVFIDSYGGEEARETLNKTIDEIRQNKWNLLIFPEGERHSGDTLLKFKKGAFHVAIAAQVPIQPIVISKYHFLDHKSMKFDSGTSFITFLPPISTEGLGRDDLEGLVGKTRELMNREFQRTSQEALNINKSKPE